MRAVGILEQMGTEYGAIDVLPVLQPLREVTTEIADWQTFPQLYVDGELLGGADLMEEMLESGELAEALGVPQPRGLRGGGGAAAAETTGRTRARRCRSKPEGVSGIRRRSPPPRGPGRGGRTGSPARR